MEQGREIVRSEADQTLRVPGETADDPSIGELINGRYSVLSRIAEGPTGKLYRARDVKTEAEVTLKLLTGWPGLDETIVRQLRDELSVTRELTGKRSNIALVHDCDRTEDGRAFVVLEPLEGRSLLDLIRRREPLSVERALRLAFQIAEGLHEAHVLGLVHGALDAEHVLVQGTDTVKVVGFEVARRRAASRVFPGSSPATSPGTAGPWPSERAEVLTEAADTQAVGMMLLEMLTSGVRPEPQGASASPGSHLEPQRGGEVPAAVRQLIMQALVRSPGPPSDDMGALAKALSAELSRRPEPSAARAWRRARPTEPRRQWTLIGGVVLAALISALVGWVTWSTVAAPRPRATSESPVVPAGPVVPDPVPSVPGPAPPPTPSVGAVEAPSAPPPLFPPPVTPAGPLAPERPVVTTVPPGGEAVAPPVSRVRPRRPQSPALDTPSSTAVEDAPARPRVVGSPSSTDSGSARPEPDAPDPSAIIDWLLKEKGSPPERR